MVSGTLRVDGHAPIAGPSHCNFTNRLARVFFVGASPTVELVYFETWLPCDGDGSWSIHLPTGTYAVYVDPYLGSSKPDIDLVWGRYLVLPTLHVTTDLDNLVLEETTYPVQGRVTVDGATPTTTAMPGCGPSRVVNITFTDAAQGYTLYAGVDCAQTDFAFATRLPRGRYDVGLRAGPGAETFGVNLVGNALEVVPQLAVP